MRSDRHGAQLAARLRCGFVDPAELLARVGEGDESAWNELVDQFAGLVWSVARSFRLGKAATDDVVQTVWLRLAENSSRIRQPDRLASWLATTTRNESLRVIRQASRFTNADDRYEASDPTSPSIDDRLVDVDDRERVMAAFGLLTEEDQRFLRLLCAVPPIDYETIAEILGRPIGSIGPTRARCLERLRRLIPGEAGSQDKKTS
jgi:RNA polymerase sigma factor (sigma-70 family)